MLFFTYIKQYDCRIFFTKKNSSICTVDKIQYFRRRKDYGIVGVTDIISLNYKKKQSV